jgi:hypothetical protein
VTLALELGTNTRQTQSGRFASMEECWRS